MQLALQRFWWNKPVATGDWRFNFIRTRELLVYCERLPELGVRPVPGEPSQGQADVLGRVAGRVPACVPRGVCRSWATRTRLLPDQIQNVPADEVKDRHSGALPVVQRRSPRRCPRRPFLAPQPPHRAARTLPESKRVVEAADPSSAWQRLGKPARAWRWEALPHVTAAGHPEFSSPSPSPARADSGRRGARPRRHKLKYWSGLMPGM